MRVREIRVYPIKSIRGVSLPQHEATPMGFEYDRNFMLRRNSDQKNMHVPDFPSMCLFTTELHPADNPTVVRVTFAQAHAFDQPTKALPEDEKILEVPLRPDVSGLESTNVDMHHSGAQAHVMPAQMSKWFSDRFGFEVCFLYIGQHRRKVLGNFTPAAAPHWAGDPDPYKKGPPEAAASSWLGSIKSGIGGTIGAFGSYVGGSDSFAAIDGGITFSDCAPFMVVNYKSYMDAQSRVDADIDIEKFRPNIVIDDTNEEWEEDYWAELSFGPDEENGPRMAFTSNCGRCPSLNVDYETGKAGKGETGRVLASLQKDRRVDPGAKWSPIFGRYGFLSLKGTQKASGRVMLKVGDEVRITKTNERRSHSYWPGVGIYK